MISSPIGGTRQPLVDYEIRDQQGVVFVVCHIRSEAVDISGGLRVAGIPVPLLDLLGELLEPVLNQVATITVNAQTCPE